MRPGISGFQTAVHEKLTLKGTSLGYDVDTADFPQYKILSSTVLDRRRAAEIWTTLAAHVLKFHVTEMTYQIYCWGPAMEVFRRIGFITTETHDIALSPDPTAPPNQPTSRMRPDHMVWLTGGLAGVLEGKSDVGDSTRMVEQGFNALRSTAAGLKMLLILPMGNRFWLARVSKP
ncbi:hypothetical protein OC835_007653, partial [Tilletia horrida]